jgi:hypothetical protein
VYGYKSINKFKDQANQVSCIKFRNDLKNSIDGLIGDYGSTKIKEILTCSDSTKVCFVETYEDPTIPQNIDPIIKDSVLSGTGRNVFLVDQITKDSFFIGNISVEPDVLCIVPTANKIRLRMESFGDHVAISRP